jgi:dienelactone hydrolase
MHDLASLTRPSEWVKIRGLLDANILKVLGQFPKERGELQTRVVDEMSFPGFIRQRVNYFVDEWERVTAWLFLPEGREEVPAILCLHDRVPQGKDEPAGIEGDPLLAFARHYAELGFATLAPDTIAAGERVSTGLEPFDTKAYAKDYPKLSVMGKLLWDNLYAMDLLADTRQIDPSRIGVIGHGLGATGALFLSAFDERVQACVASCGFTRFEEDPNVDRWVAPDGFVQMTKLGPAVKEGEFPFDWEHVLAMAAPIPTLLITALNDETLSNTKSCEDAAAKARSVYALLAAREALQMLTHRGGRCMTPEALEAADEWFQRWL